MSELARYVKLIESVKNVMSDNFGKRDWDEYAVIACEFDNYVKTKRLSLIHI